MELLENLTDLAGIFVLQFVAVGGPVTVLRLTEAAYFLDGVLSAEGSGGPAISVVTASVSNWLLFFLLFGNDTKILRDVR